MKVEKLLSVTIFLKSDIKPALSWILFKYEK